jgi:hypothetical protein
VDSPLDCEKFKLFLDLSLATEETVELLLLISFVGDGKGDIFLLKRKN